MSTPRKAFSHFIIIPTPATFTALEKAKKQQEKLAASRMVKQELILAINQAAVDLNLAKSKCKDIFPHTVFLHAAPAESDQKAHTVAQIEQLLPDAKNTEVVFTFSSHGSPERVGINADDKLDPVALILAMHNTLKVAMAKGLRVNLIFRACNSAYVQFGENNAANATAVMNKSFIGNVAKCITADESLSGLQFAVQGYRGYYLPDAKEPQLAPTYELARAERKKNKIKKQLFSTSDGVYCIARTHNGLALFPPATKYPVPNNTALHEMYPSITMPAATAPPAKRG